METSRTENITERNNNSHQKNSSSDASVNACRGGTTKLQEQKKQKEEEKSRKSSDMFALNLLASWSSMQSLGSFTNPAVSLKDQSTWTSLTFSSLSTPKIALSSGFSRVKWKTLQPANALLNDTSYHESSQRAEGSRTRRMHTTPPVNVHVPNRCLKSFNAYKCIV